MGTEHRFPRRINDSVTAVSVVSWAQCIHYAGWWNWTILLKTAGGGPYFRFFPCAKSCQISSNAYHVCLFWKGGKKKIKKIWPHTCSLKWNSPEFQHFTLHNTVCRPGLNHARLKNATHGQINKQVCSKTQYKNNFGPPLPRLKYP